MLVVSLIIIAISFLWSLYLTITEMDEKDRFASMVVAMFSLFIAITLILCYIY